MDDTQLKTTNEEKKAVVGADVEEHPISETDAKKYAGVGDFSLPMQASPLGDLLGKTQPTTGGEKTPAPAAKPATVKPMPTPRVDATKDLEKKAKEMLKGLVDTEKKPSQPEGTAPKKRKSGTATKMALAAVLMVMMGAGGIAGMNLLKMQQAAENRSQADNVCEGITNQGCEENGTRCQGEGGTETGYLCTCINLSRWVNGVLCPSFVWSCNEWAPKKCDGPDTPPATAFNCPTTDGGLCTNKPGTYNWYECEGATLPSSKGCQDKHVAGPTNQSSGCFLDPSPGFCGVQQLDVYISDEESCFMSREIPCDGGGGGGEETPLACTSLKASGTEQIGETITLTCAHSGDGKDKYEYRYKVEGEADWTSLGTSNSLTVTKAGNYTAQCRVCKADNSCTTWGLAK